MSPLPDPIDVPWALRPLDSADTRLEHLDDGRLRLSIVHGLLEGVTPEMLVFWFQHIEGSMAVAGRSYPRYRVWHPRDHVGYRLARRGPDGAVGPGAVFAIHEVLGRDPRHVVDVLTDVVQLDVHGFHHRPRRFGLHPVDMPYRFSRVAGGTRYENELIVGFAGAPRWLNARLVARAFDEAHGRAWLLHNVEEVGAFQDFLPDLYHSAHGRSVKGEIRFEGPA